MNLNLNDIYKRATTPSAFSTYAVIGVVATTVLAIVCTRKQCQIEAEKKAQTDISENQFEDLTREEVIEEVKQTAKTYAPVIVSALATAFCIKHADAKWIDYNSLINTNYLAARDKMARYRMLAPAAVGAEVLQGFGNRKPTEGVEWFCIKDCVPYYDEDGRTRYHDLYFQSTELDIMYAEYHLNRNFQKRGSASFKEFCAFLGIIDQCPEEFDDYFGWDVGTLMEEYDTAWIDFEHWHTTDPSTGQIINMIAPVCEASYSIDGTQLAYGYLPTGSYVTHFNSGPLE